MTITPTYSYTTHAGDVGTMPPFIYHKTVPLSDAPYDRYLIKFTLQFVNPLIDALGRTVLDEIYSQLIHRFRPELGSRLQLYFQEMLQVFQSNSRHKKFRLQCMLCDLLFAILDHQLPPNENHTMYKTPLTTPIIDAVSYMEQHYRESPSLEATALLSGYSASHFSRLFHAQLGTSYSEYLAKIRLRHVQDLLLNTKKSITEIALDTGYLHVGNLSGQFKQYIGMTPLQYRKTNIHKAQP